MSRFNIISPTNGQVLAYDSTNDWWENATASGGSDPWTTLVLASQADSTSTTPANLTGMTFTPAANKTYLWEFYGFIKSTTPTNAARVGLVLPTTDCVAAANLYQPNGSAGTNTTTANLLHFVDTVGGGTVSAGQTTSNWALVYMYGLVKTGASPSGSVQVQLSSEANALGTQSIGAGSFLRYREIS